MQTFFCGYVLARRGIVFPPCLIVQNYCRMCILLILVSAAVTYFLAKREKNLAVYRTWVLMLTRRRKKKKNKKSLTLSYPRVQKECVSEVKCKFSKQNASVLDKHGSYDTDL